MVFSTPPKLEKLASQSLVRNEALTTSAAEYLPKEFFIPLLKEAGTQRKAKMIKILVEYWPYPFLHVGLLSYKPNFQIFQAILAGVDTWLKRKYRPRMCRLQLVDLRHHDGTDMQDGREGRAHRVETVHMEQVLEGQSRYLMKQRLKVFSDLSFMSSLHEDKHQTELLQWTKERKDFLHLCCEKLEIGDVKVSKVRDVLKLLQLEFIKELELNTVGKLSKLTKYVSCISKMRNLEKLTLARSFGTRTFIREERQNVTKIFSLFPKLKCLKHLTIDDVYFVGDSMRELFRYLEAQLVSLNITLCGLSQTDLDSFPQHLNYSQLKHLCLRGATLTDLNVVPLRDFLENVAYNLETLELEDCGMKDSHLSILQPALIQCSELSSINLYDNDISMGVLVGFLLSTIDLSELTTEKYPAPVEIYNEMNYVDVEMFSELGIELMNELLTVRQPDSVSFGSNACYDCGERYVYEDGEVIYCLCQE
ncbi:preferentially expressed antigen in melanoma-like protein 7 [Apodemus sylvaticus]|uniref:preferentially expressed antigen in melanoma-like protein 7 n=1 Tax=Apodemus sylvaticus TaxID=10129 RepID=UPI0022442473|nr:preferentially expressed antigen in melanoma-like protein 7 [Apodemus sylvaticus]